MLTQVSTAMDYMHKHATKELPTVIVNIQRETMMALRTDMCAPCSMQPAEINVCPSADRSPEMWSAGALCHDAGHRCLSVYSST